MPGGFAYGDYLRTGAIAKFAPVMQSVAKFAKGGGLVLGICNGFQILCEAGLLPGALMRNASQHYICKQTFLRTETVNSPFTPGSPKDRFADADGHMEELLCDAETLAALSPRPYRVSCHAGGANGRRESNGSLENIAGV